jgi:hypothetical protein
MHAGPCGLQYRTANRQALPAWHWLECFLGSARCSVGAQDVECHVPWCEVSCRSQGTRLALSETRIQWEVRFQCAGSLHRCPRHGHQFTLHSEPCPCPCYVPLLCMVRCLTGSDFSQTSRRPRRRRQVSPSGAASLCGRPRWPTSLPPPRPRRPAWGRRRLPSRRSQGSEVKARPCISAPAVCAHWLHCPATTRN